MQNVSQQLLAILFFTALIVSTDAVGQGTITANNINGIGTPTSTDFGLFFDFNPVLYEATPINVTILGGPDPNSLSHIVTLSGLDALVLVSPGRYTDPSGGIYTIPGVAQGQLATLQVLAWVGSAATFGEANPAVDVFSPFGGTSYVPPTRFTFSNPTGGFTPSSLDGMPAMWRILDAPEPTVLGLLILGGVLLGWRLGRKPKLTRKP